METTILEFIFDYLKNEPQPCFWNDKLVHNCWREVYIYKTKKGQYFLHIHKGDKDGNFSSLKERIVLTTEDEVRQIISKLSTEKYIKIFGNVEEG